MAAGAKLWLVHPLGFEISEKHVRRAGLDYWQHVDLQEVPDWSALATALSGKRMWFYSKKARAHYADVEYQPGDVLVFGSETRGLPDELLEEHAERVLGIPMRPPVRSLNLSASVAVVMFEALRQWRARE